MRKLSLTLVRATFACILTLALTLFNWTNIQAQCSGSDSESPVISCPDNVVVDNTPGECGAIVDFDDATATDNCPPTSMPGYMYKGTFNGHTYFVSTFAQDGATAINTAAATGGHLATISSAAENNFVASIAGGLAWIGLTDQASEGNFVWVTGEPVTFTRWNFGEPNNNTGNENWVEINRGGFGRWNDLPPFSTRPLIVEFDEAPVQVAQTGGPASGSFFPVGDTEVTYTATDAAGNSSSCSFTVTVNGVGDADCDDVSDDCDVCPGGDDNGPCDAESFPGFDNIPAYWKCHPNGKKVSICHNGNTICVNSNAVQAHLNHGDFLGPCTSCEGQGLATAPDLGFNATAAEQPALKLFPNPATNQVTIELHGLEGETAQLTMFDQLGRVAYQRTISSSDHHHNVELGQGDFAQGRYFVRVISAEQVLTESLIIQR